MRVYIDPTSPYHLGNVCLEEAPKDAEDGLINPWHYIKEYCEKKNIILNTIDFYDKNKATKDDIYVSFEHKGLFRQAYWWFRKNRNYPVNIARRNFKKKILLQGEPPMADPLAYQDINGLFKIYDKIYFPFKSGDPRISYYRPSFQRYKIPEYWSNKERKFLVLINANKSPWPIRKILFLMLSRGGFKYVGHRELLTERLRAIEFFGRTNEIDLYGYGWDKPLFFPYFLISKYKKSVQKAYKGSVSSKLQTLSQYKFAITYENCSLPGHISEKIFDCFYAGTVPVYLGATDIEEYIPKNCFIDMRDFSAKGGYNYEKLRRFLKSLSDTDIEKYRWNAREFLQSEKMKPFTNEYFARFFINQILS